MSPRLRPALALAAILAVTSNSQAAFTWSAPYTATSVGVHGQLGATSGSAYWDNASLDGSQRNVGYFLNKEGAYTALNTPEYIAGTTLQYDTSAIAGFTLSRLPNGVGGGGSILVEVAGNRNFNDLYARNGNGTYTKIIDGAQPQVGGFNFSLSGVLDPFALVLVDTTNKKAFFTTGENYSYTGTFNGPGFSLTPILPDIQNFAVFRDPTSINNRSIFIGVEDMRNGDYDYNDLVIKMTLGENEEFDLEPAPAPAGLVLALCGIVPCVALRRRLLGQKA